MQSTWRMSLALVPMAATLLAQGLPPGGPGRGFGPPGIPGMGHGKVVTGAPYSADVSNQISQTLADGNTINRATNGHAARDSRGRTYSQETITGGPFASNGPVTITFISDPVAGYAYVLNSDRKVAMRRVFKAPPNGAVPGDGRWQRRKAMDADAVTNDLGTQIINGVSATGKSVTRTVPPGQMGNSQAIVSTSETWYSVDLQILVSAKRNDPRLGQSIFAVSNIQRSEPAASLFQVPADYTIKDARNEHGGFGPGPGGPRPVALNSKANQSLSRIRWLRLARPSDFLFSKSSAIGSTPHLPYFAGDLSSSHEGMVEIDKISGALPIAPVSVIRNRAINYRQRFVALNRGSTIDYLLYPITALVSRVHALGRKALAGTVFCKEYRRKFSI